MDFIDYDNIDTSNNMLSSSSNTNNPYPYNSLLNDDDSNEILSTHHSTQQQHHHGSSSNIYNPHHNHPSYSQSQSFFPISSPSQSASDILTSYRCVLLNYPVNGSSSSTIASSLLSSSNNPTVTYYTLWLLNNNPLYPPSEYFTPLHHILFQLSQLVLLCYVIGYGGGGSSAGLCGYVTLSLYLTLQLIWGLLIMKGLDIFCWAALLLSIVILKFIWRVLCGHHSGSSPIGMKSPGGRSRHNRRSLMSSKSYSHSSFVLGGKELKDLNRANANEVDLIYNRLFAPVRVSYKQFMRVVGCKRGFKVMTCGENYAVEKRSRVDSLGLLVSGRLVVSQGGKPLHVILPFQFVDSPEYFGVATDELFQVTITALEESKLLVWHRDKLRLTIMNDEFLRVMFDHIIGRDVVRKLIQVSDTIMTPTTTNYSSSTQSTSTTSSLLPPPPINNNNNGGGASSSSSSSNGISSSTSSSTIPSSNNNSLSPQQQLQLQPPLILLRKDKYAYQPTYLTSLSEEKIVSGSVAMTTTTNGHKMSNGGGSFDCEEEEGEEEEEECEEGDEEEEEEEEDDDDQIESVCISGNEKEPMLGGVNGGSVVVATATSATASTTLSCSPPVPTLLHKEMAAAAAAAAAASSSSAVVVVVEK